MAHLSEQISQNFRAVRNNMDPSNSNSVVMLMNKASESAIPLEIAAGLSESNTIKILPVSLYPPSESVFSLDVHSLDADSLTDISAYKRWFRFVSEKRPDIVHIQGHTSGGPARILAAIAGVPNIVSSEHNPHPRWPLHKRLANKSTNWLSDAVICNSCSTRESLTLLERKLFQYAGTEVTVIHHGIDVSSMDAEIGARDPPQLPDANLVLGFAGRLVRQKNPKLLVRAICDLDRAGEDVALTIVGKGPLRDDLETLAKDLGVSDNVQFYGFLPERADVWAFMDAVDIMAYPSEYEGFGVAAAESMATGTPTVLSDIPVYREVANDAAEFVDRTVESLTTGIQQLSDPKVRNELGERGRERIRSNFRIEETISTHERLYEDIISGEF